jgi:hypothetical protein
MLLKRGRAEHGPFRPIRIARLRCYHPPTLHHGGLSMPTGEKTKKHKVSLKSGKNVNGKQNMFASAADMRKS